MAASMISAGLKAKVLAVATGLGLATYTYPRPAGIAFGVFAGFVALLYAYLYPYRAYTSPSRNLPGPERSHWFFGNLLDNMHMSDQCEMGRVLLNKYGPTGVVHNLLGSERIYTSDLVAIGHILANPDVFTKPFSNSSSIRRLMGYYNLLTAEDDLHRRLRRVLNPSFGTQGVKNLEHGLYHKARAIREQFSKFINDPSLRASPTSAAPQDVVPNARKIDVGKYFDWMSVDIVGEAAFGHKFNSFEDGDNVLFKQYNSMSGNLPADMILIGLSDQFNWLDKIPTAARKRIKQSRALMDAISRNLIAESRNRLAASGKDDALDMLSQLLRSDKESPKNRLSPMMINEQKMNMILAGADTVSASVAWLFYHVAVNPDVQARLRAEIQAVDFDEPPLETLDALPYVDKVVREVLRLVPVGPTVRRAPKVDTMLPLGTPVRGKDGRMLSTVVVPRGTEILLELAVVNRNKDIWGEDADTFNPDRWDRPNYPGTTVPGIYANTLTFIGGPKACLGYRMSIAEMKVALFVLLRTFSFEELPSRPTISMANLVVVRPYVEGEPFIQCPLLVRRLEEGEH